MYELNPTIRSVAIWIVVIAVLLLAVGWIYSKPSSHSMIILNYGSKDVVITKVSVNGKDIDTGERILKPIGPAERDITSNNRLSYLFKAVSKAVMSLDFTDSTGKKETLSCDLVDQYGVGCRYIVRINNTGKLTSICDSDLDGID